MEALHAGILLARRYRLVDRIGSGGMSVIWRARDEVLDRIVAVKVLAPSLAADARFRTMVRQEARSAAQLVHPHVTSVHDYGEAIAPDGTITAFVVMELLNGEELERRLTAGALPWDEAVRIGVQVADALAAAHRLGIVHRDITPANVMMTAVGAKVLDFGIATRVGTPDDDEDGGTFGTPAYVAPERLDGAPAQPSTDVYSLGVLLHEMLTGRVPYPADTWEELGVALATRPPPSLAGVPELPSAVVRICLRCLDRDPAERPTARQVAEALDRQLATVPPQTVPLPSAEPAATALPSTASTGRVPADPVAAGRQPPQRWAFGLLAGVVVVVVPVVVVWPQDPAPPPVLVAPTTAPVTTPVAPAPTGTTGQCPTRPPTSPSPSPVPVSPAGETLEAAVNRLNELIDAGVSTGEIRPDVGLDLDNHLRNLTLAVADGEPDVAAVVAQLREKVARRVSEGAITPGYARQLDAALRRLAAARA